MTNPDESVSAPKPFAPCLLNLPSPPIPRDCVTLCVTECMPPTCSRARAYLRVHACRALAAQLFEQHVGDLTRGIVTLENAKDRERYRLEEDPDAGPHTFKVEFRNVDADGQQYWSAKDYNGYCNAFQYIWRMKQQKRNNIKGGPGRAGNLQMQLGAMSYAEVPAAFPFIFGVTGSLDTLPDKQRAVLKDKYNVRTFSYFPSFWETKEQKRLLDWVRGSRSRAMAIPVCSVRASPLSV